MPPDDGVSVIDDVCSKKGESTMDDKDFFNFYTKSMLDGRDERATFARRFNAMLEFEYVEGKDFRAAQAMQVAKESGAGQTRAQTAMPGPFATEQKT